MAIPRKINTCNYYECSNKKNIPLYGNGENIRDWLFVEDHVDAILLVAKKGLIGESYCIGGNQEKSNKEIMSIICEKLNKIFPKSHNHLSLIKMLMTGKVTIIDMLLIPQKCKMILDGIQNIHLKRA